MINDKRIKDSVALVTAVLDRVREAGVAINADQETALTRLALDQYHDMEPDWDNDEEDHL